MKILIATGLYPPDIGGPATYAKFLEAHLLKYGIAFDVIPFGVVRKYPKILRHLVYCFLLIRKGWSADIIYALDTVSVGVPACISSFLLCKKFFLRVPGDYAWEQGQTRFGIAVTLDDFTMCTHGPWQVRFLSWLQNIVARSADRVIVPSEYMRGIVRAWGISEKKISRIYSTPHKIVASESKEELRTQFGYHDFVILTAARLVPWKGISKLIDVVKILRAEGMAVSLEILGDGVCRDELEEKVRTLAMGEFVHLRGNVERQEMGRRIKGADVFVLNTSYEGFSHQLIEVMSLGVPIITTPVGGNRELIQNDETGLLTEFNDVGMMKEALLKICTNLTLVKKLATNAEKYVERFNEDTAIQEFLRLLKQRQ